MAQSALGDPNDPRWTGVAPSPDAGRARERAGAPSPSQAAQSPQMAAAERGSARSPSWSRTPQNQPAAPADRPTARPSPSEPRGGTHPADSA